MKRVPCERHHAAHSKLLGELHDTTTPEACAAVAKRLHELDREIEQCAECRAPRLKVMVVRAWCTMPARFADATWLPGALPGVPRVELAPWCVVQRADNDTHLALCPSCAAYVEYCLATYAPN